MKRLFFGLCLLLITVAGNAQFEKGKFMANASLSSANLSYSTNEKTKVGASATACYFLFDNFGLLGSVGMDLTNDLNTFNFGMGARVYFKDCGLFVQGGLQASDYNYKDSDTSNSDVTDFGITSEFGYTFFLSHSVAVEPAAFYNLSLKDGDYSKFGVKIGFDIFF